MNVNLYTHVNVGLTAPFEKIYAIWGNFREDVVGLSCIVFTFLVVAWI